MITVAHGIDSGNSGDIQQNPSVEVHQESEERKCDHRLVVTRTDEENIERFPDHLEIFCPESEQLFSELYHFYRQSDIAHLYTLNQRPIHRLPAYMAGIPIIDQPLSTIPIENVNRVEKIICASKAIARAQKAPARIERIPGGIKIEGESPSYGKFKNGEPLQLLEIAGSETEPMFTAEDYMPPLHQRFPAIQCHIIGREGDNRQGMVYHGEVNNPKPYFRRAHFLVQFMDDECFRQTVLQAYRHGTIPIVSGKGMVREQIDHTETGFLMESPNKGEVIQQLRVIIEQYQKDPSFWIPMAENGFELLTETYSKNRHRAAYQSLYDWAAGNPVKGFAETSWSLDFNQFFRTVSYDEPADLSEKPDLENYSNPFERDVVRLTYLQFQQSMDPGEAIEWLNGMETDPMLEHYEICRAKARFYQKSGNNSESQRCAEDAIEKEPDLPECYFILADSLLKKGSVEAALETLLQFQQNYPGYEPMVEMIKQIKQIR